MTSATAFRPLMTGRRRARFVTAEITLTGGASPSLEQMPDRSPENSRPDIHSTDGRAILYDRDRGYRLSESEIRTIAELGRFRVIASHDLAQHAYAGREEQAEPDIQNLVRKGLVRKGTFEGPEATPRELLTLTKRGHRLLRANQLVPTIKRSITASSNPGKPITMPTSISSIRKKRPDRKGRRQEPRVILDYELKRKINRDLARFGTTARNEIGQRHGLRVVRNKIPIPDMRIEYETREGEIDESESRDWLPSTTGDAASRRRSVQDSRSIRPHGEGDHLRRVLDQHELTAEILSL